MKSTDIIQPAAISAPIAYEGLKNQIPENATGTELASIAEGFPEITMKNPKDGGLPPRGQDCNGMFYLSTDQRVYLQNGGLITFSQSVSDTIGGYPLGAVLDYINSAGVYSKVRSLINDNTYNFVTNPSYIDNIHWQTVSISSDYSGLLANNQVTNCILTSNDPSITSQNYTDVSYVNVGCSISGTTASGFGASNYILLSKTMTSDNTFTLEIPFVLTSAAGTQTIAYINNEANSIGISNGVLTLNYDGYTLNGTTQLAASTAYTVKLTRTAANYTVQLKTAAGDYGDAEISLTSSLGYFGGKSIYLGGSTENYLRGSIDLSGVVITASDTSYWTNTTTSSFQTVNISGTFQVLMPNKRNSDLTLNNINQSITLNKSLLYIPAGGTKTILVASDGEIMIRDYYEESYNEVSDTPLNGVWVDKTTSIMKSQLSTYPNLIINGATFSDGVGSNFSQTNYLELPESYNLGSAWSIALNVNIETNASSQTNVILGNMTAAAEGASYPYLPDNIAIVYDGNETVSAYLRREDVYIVSKTEVVSTAYTVTKTVSEVTTTGYVAVSGDAESYVPANTQVYSDTLLTVPLETASADTWQYTGESEQNSQDITGYVREEGTTLVSSGVTVYSDANLTTTQGVAAGTDWIYTGDTAPSLIGALTAAVTAGTNTLTLSFNGTSYAFNGTSINSTDTIKSNFNVYLGSAPSYTNGYFNSTIDIGASTFSFWNWNGESSNAQNWVEFVGCKIGTITDDGSNITSLALDYPLCLAKDYDVVHNTGDENINGIKTFKDYSLHLSTTGAPGVIVQNIDRVGGQTYNSSEPDYNNLSQYPNFEFRDKNFRRTGRLENYFGDDGSIDIRLTATKYDSTGAASHAILRVGWDKNGNYISQAPTPTANNNSTQIATTAFVKDCFTNSRSNFITFSKAANGYIKFSNGMCLQWGSFSVPNTRKYLDITFPRAFNNQNYKIVCMDYNTTATTESSINTNMSEASTYRKTTGTRMLFQNQNIGAVEYIVVGY